MAVEEGHLVDSVVAVVAMPAHNMALSTTPATSTLTMKAKHMVVEAVTSTTQCATTLTLPLITCTLLSCLWLLCPPPSATCSVSCPLTKMVSTATLAATWSTVLPLPASATT